MGKLAKAIGNRENRCRIFTVMPLEVVTCDSKKVHLTTSEKMLSREMSHLVLQSLFVIKPCCPRTQRVNTMLKREILYSVLIILLASNLPDTFSENLTNVKEKIVSYVIL